MFRKTNTDMHCNDQTENLYCYIIIFIRNFVGVCGSASHDRFLLATVFLSVWVHVCDCVHIKDALIKMFEPRSAGGKHGLPKESSTASGGRERAMNCI